MLDRLASTSLTTLAIGFVGSLIIIWVMALPDRIVPAELGIVFAYSAAFGLRWRALRKVR